MLVRLTSVEDLDGETCSTSFSKNQDGTRKGDKTYIHEDAVGDIISDCKVPSTVNRFASNRSSVLPNMHSSTLGRGQRPVVDGEKEDNHRV
jgi:hypothetical protein